MTQSANESPEGPPSRYASMLGSAFFWSVLALPLFSWILYGLSEAHAFLDEGSAAVFWAPLNEASNPLAHIYHALWLLIPAGILWWWLGFRNVRTEAAPIGDRGQWAIAFAVAGAIAYIVAGFVLGGFLTALLGLGPEIYFVDSEDLARLESMPLLALIPGILAAPVFEELAFRGLMLGVLLARGWNPYAAIALTAAVFTATHHQYTPVGLIFIFIAGMIFGMLRVATGGLFAPMLSHALVNFMLLTPVSI